MARRRVHSFYSYDMIDEENFRVRIIDKVGATLKSSEIRLPITMRPRERKLAIVAEAERLRKEKVK